VSGSGIGKDTGYLDQVRNYPGLTRGERSELLVYVFVSEVVFAVDYIKAKRYCNDPPVLYWDSEEYIFGDLATSLRPSFP